MMVSNVGKCPMSMDKSDLAMLVRSRSCFGNEPIRGLSG